MDPWLSTAIATLGDAGFDIVHAFDTARAAREPGLDMLADPARRLGLLVGNTRALWPRFVAAVRAEPELAAAADPLDRYTERAIARAFFPGESTAPAPASAPARVWLGHRTYGGAHVPLQRLAAATGLAALAPTRLAVHPEYGPWFALRAVVACDAQPVTRAPLVEPPCRCESACTTALAAALTATGPEAWRAWLAVRDACPVGRAHRYGDAQLRYHYTKRRDLLG